MAPGEDETKRVQEQWVREHGAEFEEQKERFGIQSAPALTRESYAVPAWRCPRCGNTGTHGESGKSWCSTCGGEVT